MEVINMYEKIIQIMPVPEDLFAKYEQEDGSYDLCKIVCLGLDAEGGVHFMSYSDLGEIEVVTSFDNFVGVTKAHA